MIVWQEKHVGHIIGVGGVGEFGKQLRSTSDFADLVVAVRQYVPSERCGYEELMADDSASSTEGGNGLEELLLLHEYVINKSRVASLPVRTCVIMPLLLPR